MGYRIMVAGLGKSGISAAKLLLNAGGEVLLYDGNPDLDLDRLLNQFNEDDHRKITIKLGDLTKVDLAGVAVCVISPGIDLSTPFVQTIFENKIQIWSEIELGFTLAKGEFVAITGTNGKTSTTTLVGEIIASHIKKTFVAGNIGLPFTDVALQTDENSVTVLECSSFQLETIIGFKPHVAAILNITPDHLDRHRTMEEYVRVKGEITANQTEDDFLILNYDDPWISEFVDNTPIRAKIVYFSSKQKLEEGYYLDDGCIYARFGANEVKLLDVGELHVLGSHNYENVMAAIAIGVCMNIPMKRIVDVCRNFTSVEHRLEYVTTKYGIKYYNDSKATNPDAAIKAVKAMPGSMLLIGGGYDKGASYDEWIESFNGNVKYLVLIGQTRDKIAECAKRHGFTNIMYAESMDEAVKVCASYADSGDYVLLSPACASWGMFRNFEERGEIFKECVRQL